MADEQNSGGFSWFLAGLGAGALLGVLFAPKAGRETRDDLVSGAREGKEYLRQRSREAADQVNQYVDRSKEYMDKGRAQWEDYVNRGRRYVNEQTGKVSSAVEAGKEAYRQTAANASASVDAGKEAYQSATGTTGESSTQS
ncbi:MAG: YtxH domain-containing protein [Acidobacteriaceae bacterium]